MKELIVAATCFVSLICCPNASLGAQPIENAESFRRLAFEPLPANSWKMFNVGANDQMLNLPYGRSYYAAVALPPGSGTLELRMQQPPIPFAGIKCVMGGGHKGGGGGRGGGGGGRGGGGGGRKR